MRSLFHGLLLLSVLAAGCKKERPELPAAPSVETQTPPAKPPAAAAPAAPAVEAETPQASPPAAETAVPDAELPGNPLVEGLAGWLGFATAQPGAKTQYFWTPHHPKARAVLFSDAWKDVPVGAAVKLVSSAGVQSGRYLGTSDERYGCEDNTATMAAFSAPQELPEGPVWVLPPEAQGVEPLPVRQVAVTGLSADMLKAAGVADASKAKAVAYEAGGLTLMLVGKSRNKGQMSVILNGKSFLTEPLEKGPRSNANVEPLDVTSRDEVGVLHPYAAFRFGSDGPPAVVLGARTYEGMNFWVLVRKRTQVELERGNLVGLYFCAH
jgi:hypothetical protein